MITDDGIKCWGYIEDDFSMTPNLPVASSVTKLMRIHNEITAHTSNGWKKIIGYRWQWHETHDAPSLSVGKQPILNYTLGKNHHCAIVEKRLRCAMNKKVRPFMLPMKL